MKSKQLFEWIDAHNEIFAKHQLHRITFCLYNTESEPHYFTFESEYVCIQLNNAHPSSRETPVWKEDTLLRHMEPGLAFQLELERMSNYNINYIPTGGTFRQHLYFATRKDESGKLTEKRIFARCLLNGEAPTEEVSHD